MYRPRTNIPRKAAGKVKAKGYANGGAAKGGKKFKPPCSTNTGLYGK